MRSAIPALMFCCALLSFGAGPLARAAASPSITTNPTPITVSAGATASFTAAASGSPTPTVQWQQSLNSGTTFTNIAGATATTLSFTAAAAQNGVEYRAVFSNASGTATTTAATLTVHQSPQVTSNPVSTTANAGTTALFTAAASGLPTPGVQWQVSTNGGTTFGNVAGAASPTLSFTASASQNGNEYRAVFTNSSGTATTTAASLTVHYSPSVTTNPTSQSLLAGNTASFTAAAGGNPAPTVQWQQSTNGGTTFTNIAGATSTTLSFTATLAQNGYEYRAVFSNSLGTATTIAATLTTQAAPQITSNPSDAIVGVGAVATFSAAANGAPVPTLQWQQSTNDGSTFTNISGATSQPLTFTAAVADNGKEYRAVFSNPSGTATSTAATLTVLPFGIGVADASAFTPYGKTAEYTVRVTNATASAASNV
ncbi:MAG TPA: immunoglobulin domain-containing protein, partial [Rudaea sp.]